MHMFNREVHIQRLIYFQLIHIQVNLGMFFEEQGFSSHIELFIR